MVKVNPRDKRNKAKTLSNHRKEKYQWEEYKRGENRRFELQEEAETSSKCGANNRKKLSYM